MDRKLLKNIINTLDTVEVKGRDNLDKLLGCINALESMLKQECEVTENGGQGNI